MEDRHLISVDELRAAGALDVPAAWRKSLGVERDLFSDLFKDDAVGPLTPGPSPARGEGRKCAHGDAGCEERETTEVELDSATGSEE